MLDDFSVIYTFLWLEEDGGYTKGEAFFARVRWRRLSASHGNSAFETTAACAELTSSNIGVPALPLHHESTALWSHIALLSRFHSSPVPDTPSKTPNVSPWSR